MLKSERIDALENINIEKFAVDIALAELVRFILSEVTYRKNPDEQAASLAKVEESVLETLSSRRLWDRATDDQNQLGRRLASEYVVKLIRSIRHPADPVTKQSSIQ